MEIVTQWKQRYFVRNFDRLFDMLNTRCLEEEIYQLKPDLQAYKDPGGKRFKVYVCVNYALK